MRELDSFVLCLKVVMGYMLQFGEIALIVIIVCSFTYKTKRTHYYYYYNHHHIKELLCKDHLSLLDLTVFYVFSRRPGKRGSVSITITFSLASPGVKKRLN